MEKQAKLSAFPMSAIGHPFTSTRQRATKRFFVNFSKLSSDAYFSSTVLFNGSECGECVFNAIWRLEQDNRLLRHFKANYVSQEGNFPVRFRNEAWKNKDGSFSRQGCRRVMLPPPPAFDIPGRMPFLASFLGPFPLHTTTTSITIVTTTVTTFKPHQPRKANFSTGKPAIDAAAETVEAPGTVTT